LIDMPENKMTIEDFKKKTFTGEEIINMILETDTCEYPENQYEGLAVLQEILDFLGVDFQESIRETRKIWFEAGKSID